MSDVNHAVAVIGRLEEAQAELELALQLERQALLARDRAALMLPEGWEYERARKRVFIAKAKEALAASQFEAIPLSILMECGEGEVHHP